LWQIKTTFSPLKALALALFFAFAKAFAAVANLVYKGLSRKKVYCVLRGGFRYGGKGFFR
jgi:hypothetical protein